MNPSFAAVLAFGMALVGCAGVPVDELLASTTIVADLQVEGGARVEAVHPAAALGAAEHLVEQGRQVLPFVVAGDRADVWPRGHSSWIA